MSAYQAGVVESGWRGIETRVAGISIGASTPRSRRQSAAAGREAARFLEEVTAALPLSPRGGDEWRE